MIVELRRLQQQQQYIVQIINKAEAETCGGSINYINGLGLSAGDGRRRRRRRRRSCTHRLQSTNRHLRNKPHVVILRVA